MAASGSVNSVTASTMADPKSVGWSTSHPVRPSTTESLIPGTRSAKHGTPPGCGFDY